MTNLIYKIICLLFLLSGGLINAQSSNNFSEPPMPKTLVKGYHIGVLQPVILFNSDGHEWMDRYDLYFIGFPVGVSFGISDKVLFDLEMVPFIKPYANSEEPYETQFLFHPGVLFPMGGGFTFGLRAAFEIEQGQFGFTPLINKAFKIGGNKKIFLELVAPGRFSPDKSGGYSQILGLHLGIGF